MDFYDTSDTSHGAGCCCGCCAGETIEIEYVEPVYSEPVDTESSDLYPVDTEPVYSEPAYSEPAYTEPLYTEPVYTEPVYAEPVYAQPVDLGVVGGGLDDVTLVDLSGQPVDLSTALGGVMTIGGTDPMNPAPASPDVNVIGGSAPLGMTIEPADPTSELRHALGLGVVGGPTPLSSASTDVAAYASQLDQALAKRALGLGPLIPLTGGTVNDQLIRSTLVQGMLPGLYHAQRGLQDTMSPLYQAGDDIDSNSPYYSGRP